MHGRIDSASETCEQARGAGGFSLCKTVAVFELCRNAGEKKQVAGTLRNHGDNAESLFGREFFGFAPIAQNLAAGTFTTALNGP